MVVKCSVISEWGRKEQYDVDVFCFFFFLFFQADDGILDAQESRGLGDVYKRQRRSGSATIAAGPVIHASFCLS